ncbi:hypothetical protein SBRY_130025 [Actinacidiphila bryophytorum]|uniref:Uncharacterized protein n=1 Tax=Actinacidiphila bryophytorum TaxID=1436133 RepID=A0A9W4E4E5_9ACTN|nr:hypothetical protein SBRY_130025 [Actinacidiphila bryophytorum]
MAGSRTRARPVGVAVRRRRGAAVLPFRAGAHRVGGLGGRARACVRLRTARRGRRIRPVRVRPRRRRARRDARTGRAVDGGDAHPRGQGRTRQAPAAQGRAAAPLTAAAGRGGAGGRAPGGAGGPAVRRLVAVRRGAAAGDHHRGTRPPQGPPARRGARARAGAHAGQARCAAALRGGAGGRIPAGAGLRRVPRPGAPPGRAGRRRHRLAPLRPAHHRPGPGGTERGARCVRPCSRTAGRAPRPGAPAARPGAAAAAGPPGADERLRSAGARGAAADRLRPRPRRTDLVTGPALSRRPHLAVPAVQAAPSGVRPVRRTPVRARRRQEVARR